MFFTNAIQLSEKLSSPPLLPADVIGAAGITRQDLPEVVVTLAESSGVRCRIGRKQQWPVFGCGVAPEGILGARNIRPAELPHAATVILWTGREDGIEAGAIWRINAPNPGASITVIRSAKNFNARQIGFEGHAAEVMQVFSLT